MGEDEAGTLARLRTHRRELMDPKVAEHNGRIVKTTGDGILIEFPSVVEAVACAVEVQRATSERGGPIRYRIGINLGDVIIEDDDIFGDGVNIAARLEGLAEPGGICVSARVHEDVAGKVEATFEDIGPQALKNIVRPVQVYRVRPGASTTAPAVAPALALPEKPSIAVLPFQNMSGDAEQEYFADGMVEEIITALSRIRWLFVIARNSTFTYKGQATDVKRVGRELGVRYVLEGSVRRGGGRVRITAQLIEAATGAHLWADRFDGSLEDVFDLQDRVAGSVAGVIEPTLHAAETARSAGRQTKDLSAYDAYLRAYAMLMRSATQIPRALELLEEAIARDPDYGPALAWAAVCCQRLCTDGTSKDVEADTRKAIDYGRRALRVAGDDPATLANGAIALALLGEDIGAMTALVDRALALNPSYARGWHISGLLRLCAGEPEAALEQGETALRLGPRGKIGFVRFLIGAALFLSHRFEEAIPALVLAIEDDPDHPEPLRCLAASYAHLGRFDEARGAVARLRAITPLVAPPQDALRRAEDRELLFSGLRLAMGEGA
jgi:adenylate cyclase